MEEMTIGEVAKQAGVRPSALRYYESVGVLPVPRRVNGRRRYEGEVFDLLAIVRIAQQAGFTLGEIRTLLHGFSADTPPSARWQALARRKLPEVEALVERALGMKRLLERGLRCDCLRLRLRLRLRRGQYGRPLTIKRELGRGVTTKAGGQ